MSSLCINTTNLGTNTGPTPRAASLPGCRFALVPSQESLNRGTFKAQLQSLLPAKMFEVLHGGHSPPQPTRPTLQQVDLSSKVTVPLRDSLAPDPYILAYLPPPKRLRIIRPIEARSTRATRTLPLRSGDWILVHCIFPLMFHSIPRGIAPASLLEDSGLECPYLEDVWSLSAPLDLECCCVGGF